MPGLVELALCFSLQVFSWSPCRRGWCKPQTASLGTSGRRVKKAGNRPCLSSPGSIHYYSLVALSRFVSESHPCGYSRHLSLIAIEGATI